MIQLCYQKLLGSEGANIFNNHAAIRYEIKFEMEVKLPMKEILKTYQDRLINLSSRNRSLVLRKIYKKRSFDIYRAMVCGFFTAAEWTDFLLGREGKSFMLLDDPVITKLIRTKRKDEVAQTPEQIEAQCEQISEYFNQLTYLAREIDAVEKETGKYELFVGYPFVEGRFKDGTFVRAPLLLFPVEMEKKAGKWQITHLKEQEVLLNKVFLFAHAKYNGAPLDEMDMEYASFDEVVTMAQELGISLTKTVAVEARAAGTSVETMTETGNETTEPTSTECQKTTIELLLEVLNAKKISIDSEIGELEIFKDLTNETLPLYEAGVLKIKPFSILGQFPLSNAIYTEYQLLEGAMEMEDVKVIEESPMAALILNQGGAKASVKSDIKPEQQEIKEKDIHFVSDLDYSQEMAVAALSGTKQLVIYGPPGTGKSQTIGNIISDALAKGQKILMVSQKRAALDVIYNRLADIQSKLILIHDGNKDKQAFYKKVSESLTPEGLAFEFQSRMKREALATELDQHVANLYEMGEVLTKPRVCKLSLQQMYAKSKAITSVEDPRFSYFKAFRQVNPFKNVAYEALEQAQENILKQPQILDIYWQYAQMRQNNAYISAFNHGVSFIDQVTYKEALVKTKQLFPARMVFNPQILNAMAQMMKNGLESAISMEDIKSLSTRYTEQLYGHLLDKKEVAWWNLVGQIEKATKKKTYEANVKEYNRLLREQLTAFEAHGLWIKEVFETLAPLKTALVTDASKVLMEKITSGQDITPILSALERACDQNDQYIRLETKVLALGSVEREIVTFAYNNSKNLNDLQVIIDQFLEFVLLDQIDEIEKTPEFVTFYQSYTQFAERIDIMDAKISDKNDLSQHVIKSFWNDKYQVYLNTPDFNEFKRQAEKKRQLWPIRKYLMTFPELAFNLFPCWLMSPETVSEILPLQHQFFDLVIFDEASQMFVENALPTIYRGKKVVVAGDDKQLRPTSIFSTRLDEGEEELSSVETAAALEEESLLDLAKINYDAVSLNYHYRSRYEELINFSNYAFYGGRLNIAPNTQHYKNAIAAPIEWIKVDGQWLERKNRQEASRVVELIGELLKSRPENETLGVITFNITQKDMIEDLLEARCQFDSDFKDLYLAEIARKKGNEDVSLFVKNIENVQGDERDIIIFSVGYAKNELGKVSVNFGALSQDGGENRLNVAVSRAKKKTYVVTSIEPEELKVEGTKNPGARLFKSYLQYAKAVSDRDANGVTLLLNGLSTQNTVKAIAEDEFVDEVYMYLKNKGYEVFKDLGVSEYRVDLAIMDPVTQKFVLGIECDTRMYQNSSSVRERDLHRKRFLESRGWNIIRLFAMEWWKSPEAVHEKLQHLIGVVRQLEATADNKGILDGNGNVVSDGTGNQSMDGAGQGSQAPVALGVDMVSYGDHVVVRDCLTKETFDVYLDKDPENFHQMNAFKKNLMGKQVNERFEFEFFEYVVFDIEKMGK